VGGAVRAPRKIVDVKPIYPEGARAVQASGAVILVVIIATDGAVSSARVVRSMPVFDQAAIDAVTQWKFEPTMLNGVPVEVEMNVFINFMPE
jgi:TonB family protein